MSEAARIFFEILKLGRSPEALMARSAMAEQRGAQLRAKAERSESKKAARIMRRAQYWQDRAAVLRMRARARGAIGC